MDKKHWKTKIKSATKKVGTYQPSFDSVIDTLADILEKRDAAQEQFEREGSEIVVEHTNQGGATNTTKNPILVMICDLNRDALAYWRDLGLTPSGLKKLNDMVSRKEKDDSTLTEALKKLCG